ncbi:hypothetical protein BDZ97DRAFT_1784595 [Flammula alnicola]|nr:hypothetical protein BDZ97DRAFT_1784595 [Flammula alnicola]
MRNIRCKFFDDQGKNGRCFKGDQCPFVHPDNPDWASARPSRSDLAPGGRRSSASYPKERDRKASSSSWGAPPTSAKSTSDWDESSWAPKGPTLTSSNTTTLAQTSRNWGAPAADASTEKSQADASFGWNAVNSDPKATNGWGASSSSQGWSNSTTGGWGSGDAGWGSSDAGWGSSNSGWGSGNATSSAWGGTDGAWAGGNDDKEKKEGKGKEKADIVMRDPFPTVPPPPAPVDRPADKSTKKPDLSRLNPEARLARDRTTSYSPVPSSSSISKPPIPLPLPKRQQRPIMASLSTKGLSEAAVKLLGEEKKLKLSESDAMTATSATSTKVYSGPKGRAALFSEIVLYMQEVVVSEVVLLRAQADETRWKRTQESSLYSRATPRTRTILDAHRAQYGNKVIQARTSRNRALKHLLKLPDLAAKAKILGPAATKDVIQAYTDELKEWFQDLELHKRILMVKQEAEEAKSKASFAQALADTQSSSPERTLGSLLQRDNWTWKELKEVTAVLEDAISSTAELVYEEAYTRFDDLEDQVSNLHQQLPQAEDRPSRDHTGDIENLTSNIDVVGDNVGAQAVRAAELYTRMNELQKEIDALRAERMRMDALCIEAEAKFAEFDRRKEADDAEIRELTAQIQNLHLHRRLSSSKSSSASTPRPVKIEDILEHIRPFVVQHVKDDLTPLFEALVLRCKENQESVAGELDEMMKPVLDLTAKIRQHVLSSDDIHATTQSQ